VIKIRVLQRNERVTTVIMAK